MDTNLKTREKFCGHNNLCIKCARLRRNCETGFQEYSSKTSVHGIKYIGEENRPIWERLFWLVVFVCSVIICTRMILTLYLKWKNNPLLISYNEKETEVWTIPFPSVTICPKVKAQANIFQLDKVLKKSYGGIQLEKDELKYLSALYHVCESLSSDNSGWLINSVNLSVDLEDVGAVLEELTPEDPFIEDGCMWRNQRSNCSDIFKKIVTDEGVCYNFNGLPSSYIYYSENFDEIETDKDGDDTVQWFRSTGYKKSENGDEFPARAYPGQMGLTVLLKQNMDDISKVCDYVNNGYKVMLTAPDNIPQMSTNYFYVPNGQDVMVTVRPSMMMTPLDLKSYSPDIRQCYYEDEIDLDHFKIYTESNCLMEREMLLSVQSCNCTKFSLPNPEIRTCGTRDFECYNNISLKVLQADLGEDFVEPEHDFDIECLPTCTWVEYDVDTSQSKINMKKLSKQYKRLDSETPENLALSKLTIQFNDNEFLATQKTEMYGIADLLSNWGGLLGLFMGISALSSVELFYFSTIRVISNHYLAKKKNDKDASEEIDMDILNDLS